MRELLALLLTFRLAFAASDNVTVLKLIEKGLPKENMGLMALVSFPFEIIFPFLIGKWMSEGSRLQPWLVAFPLRVLLSTLSAFVVYSFPGAANLSTGFYLVLLTMQLSYEFVQNMMFVSICGYFIQISDTRIGGTYMTFLNTISNLGGTWPKFVALSLVDYMTVKECTDGTTNCTVIRDGYYVLVGVCAVIGVLYYQYARKTVRKLESLPASSWRCPI
eukprot:TRINITY_DN4888_c0_g1_i2.p1 TRINITY_DN4888_c0_g1~~TRINITY_DN4888_c0_g1_i2.p1  ORF type:complete len:219 (-),score=35.63 TRINITY_DN4888_c0_g1_i2:29-685(-)